MEAHAGTGRLDTLAVVETLAAAELFESAADASDAEAEAVTGIAGRRVPRLWPIVIAAVLLVLAGVAVAGGYLATQAHQKNQATDTANIAALAAAKDCVAATQPASAAAIPVAQQKLGECSTGTFGDQSTWYGEVLAQAYQAVDVRVQVPELHAAVERDNEDGSVDALVVFRATVSQTGMADRVNSYRVRVKMVPVDGQFKVAELNQVAK